VPASPRRRHAPNPKRLVGTTAAAEYAGLGVRTIYRYVAEGRLTGYRVGPKLIKIDLSELDRLARPIAAGDGR
jgi:excisionase family DNA binding protein